MKYGEHAMPWGTMGLYGRTSSSPAPDRTTRCRSAIPRSMNISCRVFSFTVFLPLHFLQLHNATHVRLRSESKIHWRTHLSFSRSFSPCPEQSVHMALEVPYRPGPIYKPRGEDESTLEGTRSMHSPESEPSRNPCHRISRMA